jgi:hypothetical protein
MNLSGLLNVRSMSGVLLILAFAVALGGILMFLSRMGSGADSYTSTAYVLERGFLMAAVVLTAVGLVLLEAHLRESGDAVLARVGATLYLIAAPMMLTYEAINLAQGRSFYPLIVTYIVLALLAQAVIGGALIYTSALPAWVGWLTLLWNIGWLIALPIVALTDMYYPILHHLMPLIIGIALLASRTDAIHGS